MNMIIAGNRDFLLPAIAIYFLAFCIVAISIMCSYISSLTHFLAYWHHWTQLRVSL